MQRQSADDFVTNNDRALILKALEKDLRIDGRNPHEMRALKITFSLDDGSCEVQLGDTRVMSSVLGVLEAPFPSRPQEGPVRFNVELSPMASPAFEAGRPSEDAIELARLLDRALRQAGAIDQEALCVLAGRKVWSLRIDTHVLAHSGNLMDACVLSALGALMAFRKPEVSIGGTSGTEVTVHRPEEKEPLPLTIHHFPVAVTFGLFDGRRNFVIDPSLKEEATMDGAATLVVNPNDEVCAVHKPGGAGIDAACLLQFVSLASIKAKELVGELKAALEAHAMARVKARVRRHVPTQLVPAGDLPGDGAAAAAMEVDAKAAALGIKLDGGDDEDMPSSSSSSGSGEETDGGLAGSAPASLSPGPQLKSGAATLKAGAARLKGGLAKSKPSAAATGSATPPKAKTTSKADDAAKKRKPDVHYDELEAIAAVIAGAGAQPAGGGTETVTKLADAIKSGKGRSAGTPKSKQKR